MSSIFSKNLIFSGHNLVVEVVEFHSLLARLVEEILVHYLAYNALNWSSLASLDALFSCSKVIFESEKFSKLTLTVIQRMILN